MRSLFFRIFLSFWLATLLIGASLVVLAVTADPRQAEFARHQAKLSRLGEDLVVAYEAGGADALLEVSRHRQQAHEPAALLFLGPQGPLSGLRAPPMASRLAAQVAATGEREFRHGRHGNWLGLPLTEGYVLVSEVAPPSRLQRLLNPYRLTLRLGVAFVITGIVSWLLAGSLSRPIRRLREAAQRLAQGDLSARVGSALGSQPEETADLGRDFDRMAERIAALLEAQRRLLRDVSHELRSPLARLGVALELARTRAGSEAAGPLDRIEREAERLNDLIGQLLTLTRLEGGEGTVRREAVDLAALVREVVQDADFEARGRNRSVHLADCDEIEVQGVPELLRRALENVVRNAVRFTAEGTEVDVSLCRTGEQGEGSARIEVRDRGPGVPDEALEHLFRPFYRVADARERQTGGGTGIGLAIAERAVRLHGGAVRAENAPGGGLVVVAELPGAVCTEGPAPPAG